MIQALQDRVLVKRADKIKETETGILLPDKAQKKVNSGTVLQVGPGRRNHDNTFVGMGVNTGDTVFFNEYAGSEIEYEGEKILVLSENEMIAVVPWKASSQK